MSLKDEVEFVKGSLSGDEKILESAFKLERLYKKNKIKIWGGLVVVLLLVGVKLGTEAYEDANLHSANESLLTLQKDPTNSAAIDNLQAKNPKLFELFRYSQATKSADIKTLESLSSIDDKIVADISRYHASALQSKSTDSQYYQELVLVEEAFVALKDNKKDLAKQKLALIGENSPVSSIARLLRHYTIESK